MSVEQKIEFKQSTPDPFLLSELPVSPGSEKSLNLGIKDNWTPENIPQIAQQLGYPISPETTSVLGNFIDTIVGQAKIANFLSILAQRVLSSIRQNNL